MGRCYTLFRTCPRALISTIAALSLLPTTCRLSLFISRFLSTLSALHSRLSVQKQRRNKLALLYTHAKPRCYNAAGIATSVPYAAKTSLHAATHAAHMLLQCSSHAATHAAHTLLHMQLTRCYLCSSHATRTVIHSSCTSFAILKKYSKFC